MPSDLERRELLNSLLGSGDEVHICFAFATRLRELMEERGMSVAELVAETGFSKSAIYKLRGKRESLPVAESLPTALHAYTIARLFGVSSDYLIGLSAERNSDSQ